MIGKSRKIRNVYSSILILPLLSTSLLASSEQLPQVEYPSLSELEMLESQLQPPVKDPYETTAEFKKRLADFEAADTKPITFYGELELNYDADIEAYIVKVCFNEAVVDLTNAINATGRNGYGAEWDYVLITGTEHSVSTGDCDDFEVPYELSKAKAIRDDISAMGKISLKKQRPKKGSRYRQPEWGRDVAFGVETYTYRGQIDRFYVGSSTSGVVASIDLKEAREEAEREAKEAEREAKEAELQRREQLSRDAELWMKEKGCPATAEGRTAAFRYALDTANSVLYRALSRCPAP